MRILHLEPLRYPDTLRANLSQLGTVDYLDTNNRGKLLQMARANPYEAIFVRLGLSIDRELIEALPNLRYIATPTTGLNHIDLDYAKTKSVEVVSLKGETTFLKTVKSTAEHTWAILLALIRRLPSAVAHVNSGNWLREPFLGSELNDKTLGIIGYGRLGQIVASYALAFGMRVIVNDIDPQQVEVLPKGIQSVSLEIILTQSDIISLHIPYESYNADFLDSNKFAEIKKGAILVNTSRGEVVEENALLQALESGQLAGAAIDVLFGDSEWESHSIPDHPLITYARNNSNLLITPHIGGYAVESIENARNFLIEKFKKTINYATNPNS